MTLRTFRGLLASDTQDRIRLEHRDGKIGYRIAKFQLMTWVAGHSASETESTVKIYKTKQTVIDSGVDFGEGVLLGAATLGYDANIASYPVTTIVVFDREIFNQDIYITHNNEHADLAPVNYYIELETISLDESEATAVILKSFRNTNSVA